MMKHDMYHSGLEKGLCSKNLSGLLFFHSNFVLIFTAGNQLCTGPMENSFQ